MNKEDLVKRLDQVKSAKEKAYQTYLLLAGQETLLIDLIKEEKSEEKNVSEA